MIKPFKSFLAEQKELILEKVSRTELNKAVSDPNVTIGIEFEFILNDISSSWHRRTEDLVYDYNSLMRDVDSFIEAALDLGKDYYSEYIDDEIGDAIENLKAKIKENEEKAEEIENSDDDDIYNPDYLQRIRSMLSSLYSTIEEQNDELDEMVDIYLESNPNNYYTALEYIKKYGNTKYPLDPIDYINENMSPSLVPRLTDELKDFYIMRGSYSESSFDEAITQVFALAGIQESFGTILDEFISQADIYNPDDFGQSSGDIDPEDIIKDYEHWDELPFTNYLLNDYDGSSTKWRIVPDASLPEGGVEVISPPLPLKKGLKMMDEMFEFIEDRGSTNNQCGMHVNMSYKGKNLANDVDKLKLMLFMDEGWVYKHFEDREDNRYAKSVLDELRNLNVQKFSINDVRNINKMFEKFTSLIMVPIEKFIGINYSNAIDDNNLKSQRIEFRYLGGDDYHTKPKRIVNGIGRFAHYLRVALNPDEKREEYIKKLLRLKAKYDEKRGGETPNISNALLSRGEIIDGYDLHKSDDITSRIEKNKFLRSTAGMKPLDKFKFLAFDYKYLNRIPKSIEPIIRGEEKFYIKYREDQ